MTQAPRPPRGALDGHQIHAIGMGFFVWGLMAVVLLFVGGPLGLSLLQILLVFVFGGGAAGAATAFVAYTLSERAGDAASAIYAPKGDTTPYQRIFSYQDAMAMRGDVAGALASFEALIAELPGDAAVRFAAAELYATRGNDPARAAALYREIRVLPGATARHEFAASNALIDLYRGPLHDEARARSELRRFAERFAGTAPGEMARRALEAMRNAPPDPAT
jgi:hypothetical protein